MPSETIVAVFDTLAHAQLAIADIEKAGIPTSSIHHFNEAAEAGDYDRPAPVASDTTSHSHGGFWSWLTGEGGEDPAAHHEMLDRSMASGHTVVTVVTDTTRADEVVSLLETHAPIGVDQHGGAYGAEGEMTSATAGSGMTTATTESGMATMAPTASRAPETAVSNGEQVISLSEETLEVGKREISRGTTRVRRFVVERPVEEQIRLRDERVSVFRRPVSASAAVDAGAFSEKIIEMTETDEEAVVGKTARVVEEVVVQKGVDERVETIKDTVRKEEVDIETPASKKI